MAPPASGSESVDVAVVGAGLAGLACARELTRGGARVALLEGAERAGGRVATDEQQGFLLDRGFQILLSAYPEARRALDLAALELRPFATGSLVQREGRAWRVVDPWRAPLRGLATLTAPFVSLGDAVRMAGLRRDALAGRGADEGTAAELLARRGFSDPLREAFLRPFFAGVTLDARLEVPAWYLLALFGWFSTGEAVLPARGMRALPEQLASGLPAGTLRLGARVASVTPRSVALESGARLDAGQVIVAADAAASARLLGRERAPDWSGTTTLYYAAERSPLDEPMLVLNGEGPGSGQVNHLCVPSDVQSSYAPAGAALVSVSVLGVPAQGDGELDRAARAQLERWYGAEVRSWRLLRADRIPRALPRACSRPAQVPEHEGVIVCGDHVATPSIQGALESGRRAAELALGRLASR